MEEIKLSFGIMPIIRNPIQKYIDKNLLKELPKVYSVIIYPGKSDHQCLYGRQQSNQNAQR